MASQYTLAAARAALSEGDLRRAESLLASSSVSDFDAAALRCEVLFARGAVQAARSLASDLARRLPPKSNAAVTALFILGECALELGEEVIGKELLSNALTEARAIKDLSLEARVRLSLLERSVGFGTPYHASLPISSEAIRAVHGSGEKSILTEAHITFARLEARVGNLHLANRHLNQAERALAELPNRCLSASVKLTRAHVLSLEGDVESAIEVTTTADLLAKNAGWMKGEAIAAGNLAFLLLSSGETAKASERVDAAAKAGYHSPNFDYAILDTRMALAIAAGDYAREDQLWSEAQARSVGVSTWYRLRAIHTRIRGLLRRGRPQEALELAKSGLSEAQQNKNRLFEYMFHLSVADAKADEGDVTIIDELAASAQSLGLLGARRFIIAKTLNRIGSSRGAFQADAAARILLAAGAQFEWGSPPIAETDLLASDGLRLDALDDAVTLLDLAGYPHVLAREAYELLEVSGAAGKQALLARSGSGLRCVIARGWTDADAIAAAANPGDRLRIICGVHRDETWELLADLNPSLSDQCTGIAIRKLVDTAVTLDRYRREDKQRAALWPADTLETDGGLWVSEQMTELLSLARRIAPAGITVLLTGETGTGKEVLARAIHQASGRGDKPFVPFNCTAVPREMLESQLFGYRKGAFTGADIPFEGVIRAAAGGTLFLDEIAEIGPELQPKLLRFLETHEVHGLGEAQPVKVDVRIIAATNADIETLVSENRFREDLFYRLNVVRLRLPPLRERREEIPPLVEHYLRKFADEQKKGRLTLDDETLEYLVLYSWPGNVRQLVNEISRVVAYAEPDGAITPALLSPEIQASRRTVRVLPGDEPEIRVRLDQPLNEAVDAIERVMVLRALDRANGNYENAAKLLGISRKGLFLKRRRWGLQRAAQAS